MAGIMTTRRSTSGLCPCCPCLHGRITRRLSYSGVEGGIDRKETKKCRMTRNGVEYWKMTALSIRLSKLLCISTGAVGFLFASDNMEEEEEEEEGKEE